ncbi:hypothetical protein [Pseudomonas sp. URIL14HWK12:I6]|uniref:hypothetical protein n=1 Tax=Pseudomonas sp. URIL14HWK12:I6 TaxID=1283293 RepID=UPI00210CA790|nr:hypothetical protein [Pseudomonas sp. URIL14HWK12:I6]
MAIPNQQRHRVDVTLSSISHVEATNNNKEDTQLGQAKNRGTKEQRILQAKESGKERKAQGVTIPARLNPVEMMGLAAKARHADPLFDSMTTPSEINEQVLQFARQLSDQPPVFLDCQPEPWSRQSCCDLNVIKFMEMHGGKMLCGYRIWYNEPRYIEGERHAVWTDGDTIRDVSFADSGENTIVFVPDKLAFDDAPGKIRFAFEEHDKQALVDYENFMNCFPTTRMSNEESWATFLTHEDWLAGKRMQNMIPSFSH